MAPRARILAGPILIVMVLGMMVLPLPTFLLDLLFTFNIALSVMILLVAMFTRKPLDFAAFPAVLLFATLLRLSLNVASTRVVLLHGHTGPDAAGKVIEAFGHFLVGGNFAVGIILFVILTIINFIVITKGAGRIAEVGARFTLDAMPGKQMAIDADLNAGLIGEDEARKRRAEVSQESDFFGSMDGASKFVRGDAIAGLLIMAINIIGGLIVGVAQHDMSMSDSARVYTLLTIGDGLVAQIPALVISTAAGVVVSRVSTDQDIGQQMISQLFSNPSVMFLTAGIIGIMGLIPNMPHIAFLTLAGGLAWGGWALNKRRKAAEEAAREVPPQAVSQAQAAAAEASWDDVSMVDQLGLEVGYRLIPLVDHAQNGELLHRIRSLRKKFAQDVGFLPPVVHIRDNLELKPNDYRILLSGVEVGHGVAMPGQWLAIDPGGVTMQIKGTPTTDPAFGLPALWIDGALRDQAQVAGYGGGCRHGRGHPSEPPDAPPRLQPARPPGSAAVARTHRPRLAQAGRGPGAQDAVAHGAAEGAAGPAGGRSADPRYAHHHRYAVRAWPAPCRAGGRHRWPARHPGTDRADPPLAGSRHHAAMVPRRGRAARDRSGRQAGTGAGAGADHQRRPGAGPGRHLAARDACGAGAPGVARQRAGAAGVAGPARAFVALPAAPPAAAGRFVEYGNTG